MFYYFIFQDRDNDSFREVPASDLSGSRIYGEVTAGKGGSPTLNRVGIALGFSFFPPAGDLAISSNWLSSKWSLRKDISITV